MAQLSPKVPEVLGCAHVVPLSQVEYQGHYGMSRDDEAEAIARQTAMDYEDIHSTNPEEIKRYIEVKGRIPSGKEKWTRKAICNFCILQNPSKLSFSNMRAGRDRTGD